MEVVEMEVVEMEVGVEGGCGDGGGGDGGGAGGRLLKHGDVWVGCVCGGEEECIIDADGRQNRVCCL